MKDKSSAHGNKVDCVILNLRQASVKRAKGLKKKLDSTNEGSVNKLYTIDINTGKFPKHALRALSKLKEGGKIYIRAHGSKSGTRISSDDFTDPNDPEAKKTHLSLSFQEIVDIIHSVKLPRNFSIHCTLCHGAESNDPEHPEHCFAFNTGVAFYEKGDRNFSVYGKLGQTKIEDGKKWSRATKSDPHINKRPGSKRAFYLNDNDEIEIRDGYTDQWLYTFNIIEKPPKLVGSHAQEFNNLLQLTELEVSKNNLVFSESGLDKKFSELIKDIETSTLIAEERNLLKKRIEAIISSLKKEEEQHHNTLKLIIENIEPIIPASLSTSDIDKVIESISEYKSKLSGMKLNSKNKELLLHQLSSLEENLIAEYMKQITPGLTSDSAIDVDTIIDKILKYKNILLDLKSSANGTELLLKQSDSLEENLITIYIKQITPELISDIGIYKTIKRILKYRDDLRLNPRSKESLLSILNSLEELKKNSEEKSEQLEMSLQKMLPELDFNLQDNEGREKFNHFYADIQLEQVHEFQKQLHDMEQQLEDVCRIIDTVTPIELDEKQDKLNLIAWAKCVERRIESFSNNKNRSNASKDDLNEILSEINDKKNSSGFDEFQKFIIEKVETKINNFAKRDTTQTTMSNAPRFWKHPDKMEDLDDIPGKMQQKNKI